MAQAQTLSELARAKWRGAVASEYQNPAVTARVIQVQEADDDLRKVSAVTLSKKLTERLQTALCLGRSYRSIFNEARALRGKFKAQGLDAAALAKSMKFQLKLLKRRIETAGEATEGELERLNELLTNLARCKSNQQSAIDSQKLLEEDIATQRDAWRDAWFKVDKTLEPICTEAGFLKPYPGPGKVHESSTGRNGQGERRDVERGEDKENVSIGSSGRSARSRIAVDLLRKQRNAKRAKAQYTDYRENFDRTLAKIESKGARRAEQGNLSSVETGPDGANVRDEFRRRAWIRRSQDFGWTMQQERGKLKSAQIRAIELLPELQSILSIRSSYFDVSEGDVQPPGMSKARDNIRKWRPVTARAEDRAVQSQPPIQEDLEVISNEETREKFPIRPVDSQSHRDGWYRAAPVYDGSRRYRSPLDSDEAGWAFLGIQRSEPRSSEIGLSPREGMRRAAMKQNATSKSKEQTNLRSPRDAPQINIRDGDHHDYRQYSSPANEAGARDPPRSHIRKGREQTSRRDRNSRAAPYTCSPTDASRRHSRERKEDVDTRGNNRSSDRGASRYRGMPSRESIRGRSNASHAKERQRDLMKRAAAKAKDRVRRSKPLGRERRTAMEILGWGRGDHEDGTGLRSVGTE